MSYVLLQHIADGNFDSYFGDGWIDKAQLDALAATTCDYAFAEYGIDARGKYADVVAGMLIDMIGYAAIAQKGDDYAGHWYKLRVPAKTKFVSERLGKNPVSSLIGSLGEEALKRALTKIVAEDGLRSMEEKWAANNEGVSDAEQSALSDALLAGPNPDFFNSEARKKSFGDAVERVKVEVEGSDLSNSDKAQAHGYLTAARALSDTPDPPIDLIWSILNRANNLAGIGSFFLALLTLIAMVVS